MPSIPRSCLSLAPQPEPTPAQAALSPLADDTASSMASSGTDDFVSPFEDELDVPAFLRRRRGEEEEEDTELPAFLRRQAD